MTPIDVIKDGQYAHPKLHELPHIDHPNLHLNPPEQLAPVGCWLLLECSGELFHARRTSYVEKKNRELEYELPDGRIITGRYWWTGP